MIDAPFLPTLNACLNGASGVLLVLGLLRIRSGDRERHAMFMIAATVVSAGFLASYLTYHFRIQAELGPTRFHGSGGPKVAYLVLLATHVVLAAVNLPMILRTLWLALRDDRERHRRWARWTFPIWLYVSVTGVLVYLALYVWNPPAA